MLTMSQPNSSYFTDTYPSSFSSLNYTYHVFLSFRGPDTRYGFTGHLYKALSDKGIHTFMDDEELRKGEEITPALLKAIEESWIAIVVLSKNYASSTFCLQELVKVLECVKQKGRLVLPIFYGVNPSDVRHLNESYGEAFIKHEARFVNDKEKVKRWKEALKEVSNLSGWHLQGGEYEYVFISKIVVEVSKKTHHGILHIANYPVGLESHIKKLRSLLDIEFDRKVIMVGIYGIGGIGKTTIARAMYNFIADQFEGVCFLDNVRERSNGNDGLVRLQEQLLSEIVGGNNIKLSDKYRGIPIMKQMLKRRKVLLILDDADKLYQLQTLAGGLDWFGSGSRIIITTRNEDLLDTHGVEKKYMVEALDNNEAFKLLTWNAFKSNRIDASYQGILKEFLSYCNGLPLALEVIGSNLFGKGLKEWESTLVTYKKVPDGNIQKVLKVSYDHLDEMEKQIFLNMACFFKGCNLKYVQDILQTGRALCPEYGVGVLIKRSLIKIHLGKVNMHDLIRDMGREIVRQESVSNPGKRSRLWYYEDILEVLEENKGTDEIQAIMLDTPRDSKVHWDGNAFEKMKNLRMLIVKNARFSCGPKHLPSSLRILDWERYPSSSLPFDFNPRKLIILNLKSSCLISDIPFQYFESMSEIDLSGSNLERVPSLSGAPNLRKLILGGCKNLIEVDDSIGLLDKLQTLSAWDCTNLRVFPELIHSTSLECLDLSRCLSLRNFPKILGIMDRETYLNLRRIVNDGYEAHADKYNGSLRLDNEYSNVRIVSGHLMFPKLDKVLKRGSGYIGEGKDQNQERVSSSVFLNVTSLYLHGILGDKYLSEWLPCFPNLEKLRLCCQNEVDRHLSTRHPSFASLKRLTLYNCNLTDEFLSSRLPWFPHLQSLNLFRSNFTILPECIKECHYLRDLCLDECEQLREIRGMPPNINILSAVHCTSLSVPSSSILLSQAFHEAVDAKFTLPGAMLPKWLAYKQPSQSLSFWVRNKFPEKIALWLVFGLSEQTNYIDLLVNGIKHGSIEYPEICSRKPNKPHIYVVHLERGRDLIGEVPLGLGWNHVEVVARLHHRYTPVISWMGVHMYKEGNGMENVRFTDPNSKKEKVDYLGGTGNNHAIHLTKQWCPLLVLNIDRPLKYEDYRDILDWNGVWKMQAPVKVKSLMWEVFQNALPTCMNLFVSKVINNPLCPICEIEYETIEHMFLTCEWTRPVWFGSDLQLSDDHFRPSHCKEFGSWLHALGLSWQSTVGNICWAIWKGRNEYIVEDKPVDPKLALFRVETLCKQYSDCDPLAETVVTSTNAATYHGTLPLPY